MTSPIAKETIANELFHKYYKKDERGFDYLTQNDACKAIMEAYTLGMQTKAEEVREKVESMTKSRFAKTFEGETMKAGYLLGRGEIIDFLASL